MSTPPEGDNKPKYDPRFPPGLGSWRKPLKPEEEANLARKSNTEESDQTPDSRGRFDLAEDPIEEGVKAAAMGDLKEEARLRKSVAENPVLRDFFLHGPTGLTSTAPDFGAMLRQLDEDKVQPVEQPIRNREPREINDVRPDEVEQYVVVPGWRIWERTIFSKGAYLEAAKAAESKELALRSNQHDKGYSYIYYKLEDAEMARNPKCPRMPFGPGAMAFDMPWYVLEPLTADEVRTVDELGEVPGPAGSVDRSTEVLRPDELQKILTEPNTRFRPIKFPPATI